MYFSRIRIAPTATSFDDYFEVLGKTFKAASDYYSLHQLVWSVFPREPQAKRDFLYRVEEDSATLRIYVLSKRMPVSPSRAIMVETKPFAPRITNGQRFAFSLRANPVVTRSGDDRHRRIDVVMAELHGMSSEHRAANRQRLINESGSKWLVQRSDSLGLQLKDIELLRIDSYQQHRFQKRQSAAPISFSTLDFNGVLEVSDAETFLNTLSSGIGPAKGFGCGLLMIRPM